jgi:hypothetical protein
MDRQNNSRQNLEIYNALEIYSQTLNLSFWILMALIRHARVDCGTPNRTAAPEAPETLPLLAAKAASMILRSCSNNASFSDCEVLTAGSVLLQIHVSSADKVSPPHKITDLSITF